MNKKILVGSIIAVVILVLVSLTSVVGFQSIKSNSAINSPLFRIRTQRALDEESKDVDCGYIGKGKEITIPLPTHDNRKELIKKVIDIMKRMDDKTFNKFIASVVAYSPKDHEINNYDIDEIIAALNFIRNNKDVKNYIINTENKPITEGSTLCTMGQDWKPGCVFFFFFLAFAFFTIIMALFIQRVICAILGDINTSD